MVENQPPSGTPTHDEAAEPAASNPPAPLGYRSGRDEPRPSTWGVLHGTFMLVVGVTAFVMGLAGSGLALSRLLPIIRGRPRQPGPDLSAEGLVTALFCYAATFVLLRAAWRAFTGQVTKSTTSRDRRPSILDKIIEAASNTPAKRYLFGYIKELADDLSSQRVLKKSEPIPVLKSGENATSTFEEFDAALRTLAQLDVDSSQPPPIVVEMSVEGRPLDLHVSWAGFDTDPRITLRLAQPGPLTRSPGDPVIARVVYDRHYDIGLFGLERLHPFDTHKFSRAYDLLESRFGKRLWRATELLYRPVAEEELLAVHSPQYLQRLRDRAYVARALEVPAARWLPGWLLDRRVLRPMRWATAGTVRAAQEAVRTGLAINLSGGYHHASRDRGEGFSLYSDIALAVFELRRNGRLAADDKVIYVDLDAHQGNGVCHEFFDDPRILIFDMYNQSIYSAFDAKAKRRIDCAVPLPNGCHEVDYLAALRSRLLPFLDAVTRTGRVGLCIYNAGTDIFRDDPLGGMNVSAEGVLARDRFVIDQLTSRGIPAVMLPSGGYSRESYKLLAESTAYALERFG